MPVVIPLTLREAIDALVDNPGATVLAGGTDAMVEINEGRRNIAGGAAAPMVVAVDRVAELRSWTIDPAERSITVGAGVTYDELMGEPLASLLPALAEASRTVGSPQIRIAGTLGGNLATCSPAGDALPVLSALDASIHLMGADAERTVAVHDFMVGVKRTALEAGELITAVTLPLLDGWQGYSKVGVRNAMVIATASACLAVDTPARSVRVALGSVGPTIIRATPAESFAAGAVDWDRGIISDDDARLFGELTAAESRPIDDHRSTAAYRRHAIGVMATRLIRRAFPRGNP